MLSWRQVSKYIAFGQYKIKLYGVHGLWVRTINLVCTHMEIRQDTRKGYPYKTRIS